MKSTTPLSILHIIRSVDVRFGGVAQSTRLIAQVQSELGHCVEILSLDDPKSPACSNLPCPLHAVGPAKGVYGYSPRLLAWMRSYLNKYDVVVVHGLWQYQGICTLRTFKRKDAVLYVYPHGMLDPWFKYHHPLKHLKKLLYWWMCTSHLIARADRVLFTTEEEQLLARKTFWPYKANEYVIGHGTLVDSPYITQVTDSFLNQFSFLRHKKILFSLGRIHPKKGLDLLVQAWKQLSNDPILGNKFWGWALVIAGPSDDEAYLSSLKRQSTNALAPIYFLPHLDDTLKYSAYTAAEFLILPSHQENFGIVVAEALACGTPVLITNKVNLWRKVLHSQAGWVSSDTFSGIRDLILRALNTPVDEKLSQLSRNAAYQHFNIRKIGSKLIELAYNDLNAKANRA